MPSRKDCLDEIARKAGRKREDVEDLLDEIFERAGKYEEDGAPAGEAYARARDELLMETSESAALHRRNEILDAQKAFERRRFYADTATQLAALPVGTARQEKFARTAPRTAMEAKLVGVETPFKGSRGSTAAKYVALTTDWLGGFAGDLEKAGILKIFASRALEDKWTDELFELNKTPSPDWSKAKAAGEAGARDLWELTQRGQGPGNPGVTNDVQALAIARAIRKWQTVSIAAQNNNGGWVRSYSGYITRTSHSPDRIERAGQQQWAADTLELIDARRSFGTKERQKVLDALRAMWPTLVTGDHFDYGRPHDEPIFPNVAAKLSAHRELHFKDGEAWLAYNKKYGVTDPTETVVNSLRIAARRTALLSDWGSRPREAFENDLGFLKASMQAETGAANAKISALEEALHSPALDAAGKSKIDADMAAAQARLARANAQFKDFAHWDEALRNRFAQIDGSADRPVNRGKAEALARWMAIQRMAKLGRVLYTHIATLPTKAAEARYFGIGFSQRFGRLFSGMTSGAEGSAKRQAWDLARVGLESRLGRMMSRYDIADAPHGALAKLESIYFRLTGVSSVTDNQRADFAAMQAAHLGSMRDKDWGAVGKEEQRLLRSFGVEAPEWQAFGKVPWTVLDGRTHLFPSDLEKLSDDDVRAYLKATRPASLAARQPAAADIAKTRGDLALMLSMASTDRANTAVPMPSARTRAMVMGANYRPGTGWNMAIRLIMQFKMWAVDMAVRQWGREIYGRIGDSRLERVAGLTEFLTASIVFGVGSNMLRELTQGQDPIKRLRDHPFAAVADGLTRSGFGTLLGDFLLGQYDRHGLSGVADIAGPTFGQIDNLLGIFHAQSGRERAAESVKAVRDNLPFANLWYLSHAMNVLIWHRLQEWISPGYLQRSEQRQKQRSGIDYLVSPAKTDQWVTGKRASPF